MQLVRDTPGCLTVVQASAALYNAALGTTTGFTHSDIYATISFPGADKDQDHSLAFASHAWADETFGKGA